MTKNLNRVHLSGHVGNEPEISTSRSGSKQAKFSLATNEEYTDKKGMRIKNTQWHRVIAWGPLAEEAEKYLHKGSAVSLTGKLSSSDYTDNTGAERRYSCVQVLSFTELETGIPEKDVLPDSELGEEDEQSANSAISMSMNKAFENSQNEKVVG
ncbi:single-stranded DNA-binding protein [Candidatus Nomurabacteria bacterium]|nr:single-stranded DNA-binding protein [Candidatus Nomurabacteria bacterium]